MNAVNFTFLFIAITLLLFFLLVIVLKQKNDIPDLKSPFQSNTKEQNKQLFNQFENDCSLKDCLEFKKA